jgi:hypothetical protein
MVDVRLAILLIFEAQFDVRVSDSTFDCTNVVMSANHGDARSIAAICKPYIAGERESEM